MKFLIITHLFASAMLLELTTSEFIRHGSHDNDDDWARNLRPKEVRGSRTRRRRKRTKAKNTSFEKSSKGDFEEQFIQDAVIRETVRSEGAEVQGTHLVEYNVTYLQAGYVSLANAYSNIENVVCDPGKITVRFNHRIQEAALPLMFPKEALLVVDGALFQINCIVGDTPTSDTLPTSGFLVIDRTELAQDSQSVAVFGFAGHFNMLFQEKNISYVNSIIVRRLEAVEQEKSLTVGVDDLTVTFNSKITTTASIGTVKDVWRIDGDSWWNYDPYLDFRFRFSYEMDLEVSTLFETTDVTELFSFNTEYNFLEFPVLGLELPGAVSTVLMEVLPETVQLKPAIGLGVAVPVLLNGQATLNSNFAIEAKTAFSSGQKSVVLTVQGRPREGLQTSFDIERDESFTPSRLDITPLGNIFMVTAGLETDFFAGLKPQVKIGGLGFAETSIGLSAGIELKGKVDWINTLPPLQTSSASLPKLIGCDECHKAEFDGSFVARDPFFVWKHFLAQEPRVEPMAELDLSFGLLKLCFLDDPEVTFCIDRCCDKDSACTPSADGMSGICGSCDEYGCGPCDAYDWDGCCRDSDCTTEEMCIGGVCTEICIPNSPPGYCCSNEDCTTAETPTCGSTDGHTCVTCSLDTEESCCTDSDCGDPDTFSCQDRYCMTKVCEMYNETDMYNLTCCDDGDCFELDNPTMICQSRTCVNPGNPRFTLRWYGGQDLDLHAQTPNGFHVWYGSDPDPVSGGVLDQDIAPFEPSRNAENIHFPMDGTAPMGTYFFWVDAHFNDTDSWTVSVFLDREDTTSTIPTATYSGTGDSPPFLYEKT